MRPYRGFTKEGKWVEGWYCEVDSKHYIIPTDADIGVFPHIAFDKHCKIGIRGFIEVIPETVGQFVCKDKNKKDVFAGDKAKWKESDKLIAEAYGDEAEIEAAVEGGFLFWDVDGSTFCPANEVGDIELIEEKKCPT